MKPIQNPIFSNLKSLLVGGAVIGLGLFLASADEAPRQWASDDGKYSVEASFVSYNARTKKVTLKKEDSRSVEVPLSQLSSVDQAYVKEHAPNKFKTKESGEAIKLYGITWQPEIEDALKLASGGTRRQPVMWFRVLGKLDDGM